MASNWTCVGRFALYASWNLGIHPFPTPPMPIDGTEPIVIPDYGTELDLRRSTPVTTGPPLLPESEAGPSFT